MSSLVLCTYKYIHIEYLTQEHVHCTCSLNNVSNWGVKKLHPPPSMSWEPKEKDMLIVNFFKVCKRLITHNTSIQMVPVQNILPRKTTLRLIHKYRTKHSSNALVSLARFFMNQSLLLVHICLVYTLAHWKWSSNIPSLFFSTFVYYIIRYNVHRPFGVQMHNFSVKCRFKATKKCKKSWPIALVMSF